VAGNDKQNRKLLRWFLKTFKVEEVVISDSKLSRIRAAAIGKKQIADGSTSSVADTD
jgi:hypothetical protein